MRNFFIGLILGLVLGGAVVFAADYNIILQDQNGTAISSANPLPVQLN